MCLFYFSLLKSSSEHSAVFPRGQLSVTDLNEVKQTSHTCQIVGLVYQRFEEVEVLFIALTSDNDDNPVLSPKPLISTGMFSSFTVRYYSD